MGHSLIASKAGPNRTIGPIRGLGSFVLIGFPLYWALSNEGGLDLSAEGALGLGGLSASAEPLFPIAWPFFLFNALFGFGLEFEMRKEKMEYNRFSLYH